MKKKKLSTEEGLLDELEIINKEIEERNQQLVSIPKKASKWSFKKTFTIKDRLKDRYLPGRTMLANFELNNGMHRTFMIDSKGGTFNFMTGTYVIDSGLKYYNCDAKLWMLDYHQSCSIPIKREIPVGEVLQAITAVDTVEVEQSTNPSTLKNFIESKVAEGVMKGQAIDEFLKQTKTYLTIILIVTAVTFIIILFNSGALDSVKNIV